MLYSRAMIEPCVRMLPISVTRPLAWENSCVQVTVSDLQLDHLYVVYPGDRQFPLSKEVTAAMPFAELGQTATA